LKSNQPRSNNASHIAITDENEGETSILDLKKIEDMMRASLHSNIFNIRPENSQESSVSREAARVDSTERHLFSVHHANSTISQHHSNSNHNKRTPGSAFETGTLLNDLSIASPTTIEVPHERTPDGLKKAKLRLETVCLLLQDKLGCSLAEKEKQQAAVANVLEELIFS